MRDAITTFDWLKDKHYKIPSVDKQMPNKDGKRFIIPMPKAVRSTTDCADVADCIINSQEIVDVLIEIVETEDFNTTGNWNFAGETTFDGDVEFNSQVDFNNGPVNFNNLTLNMVNVDVVMDAGSTFENNGTTTLNSLTVNTITFGVAPDLTDFISTDVGNEIIVGTDGLLYVAPGGGGFSCADVADCIDNDVTVQNALANFIENTNFTLLWDWDFQGTTTINGAPISSGIVKKTASWPAGTGDSSFTFADADSLANSVILGWTITSGTQIGFWEPDMSTPGQITIDSSATETGTIDFTYFLGI